MSVSSVKITVCTLAGMAGSVLARLFGGWTEDIATLIIFMTIDFFMGLLLAGVFHKSNKSASGTLSSKAGWRGLCKKGVILLFVLVAYRLDILLGADYIRTTAIIGFIANEAISIIENAGLMGVPLPDIVVRAIEILREDGKNEGNSQRI